LPARFRGQLCLAAVAVFHHSECSTDRPP